MARVSRQKATDPTTLQRRWQERCQSGNFSPAVLGVGTIRVFGKAGDAPVSFPRLESLANLSELEEDERWAVQYAHDLVQAAQQQRRAVMATQPPQTGATPAPTSVREFDPKLETVLIMSLTRGG
jgi:hypothetical protein